MYMKFTVPTDQVTLRLEREIVEKLKEVAEYDDLKSYTDGIRKACLWWLRYHKIPRARLDELLLDYESN